jgi:hypothetical protein
MKLQQANYFSQKKEMLIFQNMKKKI